MHKTRYRMTVLSRLLPFTYGVRRYFLLIFLLSVLSMMLGFINPLFYRMFIDDVILGGNIQSMPVVILGYLGLFLISVIIGYVRNFANYKLVNTTTYRTKLQIWRNFFSMPFSEYETSNIGDMKMRLDDDTGHIAAFAGNQTIDYVVAFVTLIGSSIVLFVIDWRLALFSIAAIPLTFWLDHIIGEYSRFLNDGNRENDQKMDTWLHASIQGWREVKALNLQHIQRRKFLRYLHNYALYFSKWINCWTAQVIIIPKIKDEFFMQFGLYFIGGLLIINGQLRVSSLLVFALYFNMLANAVRSVSGSDAALLQNRPFTDRLMEELDRQDVKQSAGVIPYDDITIAFDNVCFVYSGSKNYVLQNFNLKINPGERVAITGKSGCGKTTILKLITGMINPVSGSVSFAGIDIREINLPAMHSKIGFVMQENILINTTIRDNLLYGKSDATNQELIKACCKAYIYDFIVELPDGLDTVIGERGIKLSGGQRQRIVLARLFLRDVNVFIFDEATSALDQFSESIVHDAIRGISKDKTIIVVAHRESSLALCGKRINI